MQSGAVFDGRFRFPQRFIRATLLMAVNEFPSFLSKYRLTLLQDLLILRRALEWPAAGGDMHNRDARRAWRLVFAQLVTAALIVLLTSLYDLQTARDVLIGGSAAWLGSAVLAAWVFGPYRAQQPGRIVARFYGGEVLKIVTIALVFAAAIKGLDDLDPVAVFSAFLIVQILPPLLANRIAG